MTPPRARPDSDEDLLSRRDSARIALGELQEAARTARHRIEDLQAVVDDLRTGRATDTAEMRRLDGVCTGLREENLRLAGEVTRLRETAIEARGAKGAQGKIVLAIAGLLAAGAAAARFFPWLWKALLAVGGSPPELPPD